MWRPDGFDKEQVKRDATKRYDLNALLERQKQDIRADILSILLDALIETTADAMLEALRNQYPRTQLYNKAGKPTGVMVFIPDKEVK